MLNQVVSTSLTRPDGVAPQVTEACSPYVAGQWCPMPQANAQEQLAGWWLRVRAVVSELVQSTGHRTGG